MKERQGPTRPAAPERKAPTTVNRARPHASSAQRDAGAVDRRHRGRPIGGGGRVDFAGINRAALATLPSLLERILHDGKIVGAEYVVLNPRRADRHPSSFKINVATGQWADFATGDKGRDPVSLIAYLNDIPQAGAARELARLLRPTEGDGGCYHVVGGRTQRACGSGNFKRPRPFRATSSSPRRGRCDAFGLT